MCQFCILAKELIRLKAMRETGFNESLTKIMESRKKHKKVLRDLQGVGSPDGTTFVENTDKIITALSAYHGEIAAPVKALQETYKKGFVFLNVEDAQTYQGIVSEELHCMYTIFCFSLLTLVKRCDTDQVPDLLQKMNTYRGQRGKATRNKQTSTTTESMAVCCAAFLLASRASCLPICIAFSFCSASFCFSSSCFSAFEIAVSAALAAIACRSRDDAMAGANLLGEAGADAERVTAESQRLMS